MTDAPPLTLEAVESRCVAALTDGEIEIQLESLDAVDLSAEARARVDDLRNAVASIESLRTSLEDAIVDTLSGQGIEATPQPAAFGRPSATVSIAVATRHRRQASTAIEQMGFRRQAPAGAGAWESYQRTLPGAAFLASDDSARRIKLTWRSGSGRIGHRLLHPDGLDWSKLAAPRWLWPIYHVLHLLWMPARFVLRRRRATDLGPFLGTPQSLIVPLLRLASASRSDLVVDLGCGDGRILIEAARQLGCRGRGIESDADLVATAIQRVGENKLGDLVEIVHGDATTSDIADATIVLAFLPVAVLSGVLSDTLAMLKPGGRFVAHELDPIPNCPQPTLERIITGFDAITIGRRWDH